MPGSTLIADIDKGLAPKRPDEDWRTHLRSAMSLIPLFCFPNSREISSSANLRSAAAATETSPGAEPVLEVRLSDRHPTRTATITATETKRTHISIGFLSVQLFELEHTTRVILPRQQRPVDWRETVLQRGKAPVPGSSGR